MKPIEVIATLIHRERSRAGLSVSELAKRAGIAKSTLSQLEAGIGNPSVETLWSIANALGVPVSRLIETPRAQPRLIRSDEGPMAFSEQSNYVATLLSACPPGARRDIYRLRVQPGAPRASEPHLPGSTEHMVISTGRALVGPVDAPVELGAGDYFTYPGDLPHVFEALEPDTTAVIILENT